MRRISETERQQIVTDTAAEFPCFGTGVKATEGNPLSEWLKDKTPIFALGVDVRQVVDYVLSRIENRK